MATMDSQVTATQAAAGPLALHVLLKTPSQSTEVFGSAMKHHWRALWDLSKIAERLRAAIRFSRSLANSSAMNTGQQVLKMMRTKQAQSLLSVCIHGGRCHHVAYPPELKADICNEVMDVATRTAEVMHG